MSEKWMWSLDEMNYSEGEECDNQFDCIVDAVRENDLEHGDKVFVSKMERVKHPKFENFNDTDTLFENADDYLSDNFAIEDPMYPTASMEIRNKLMAKLNKAWDEFHEENPEVFREYYQAEDPTEIEIEPDHIQSANRFKSEEEK
jgi:hypothetical protein